MKTVIKTCAMIALSFALFGCATLTEDANTQVTLAFSDGSEGTCALRNKRGAWEAEIPGNVSVRKSDDSLQYTCENTAGKKSIGSIQSTMGGKIVASAIFLDFGIVDSITDKHRKYPDSFVIPMKK